MRTVNRLESRSTPRLHDLICWNLTDAATRRLLWDRQTTTTRPVCPSATVRPLDSEERVDGICEARFAIVTCMATYAGRPGPAGPGAARGGETVNNRCPVGRVASSLDRRLPLPWWPRHRSGRLLVTVYIRDGRVAGDVYLYRTTSERRRVYYWRTSIARTDGRYGGQDDGGVTACLAWPHAPRRHTVGFSSPVMVSGGRRQTSSLLSRYLTRLAARLPPVCRARDRNSQSERLAPNALRCRRLSTQHRDASGMYFTIRRYDSGKHTNGGGVVQRVPPCRHWWLPLRGTCSDVQKKKLLASTDFRTRVPPDIRRVFPAAGRGNATPT